MCSLPIRDVQVLAGRPVAPRTSLDVHIANMIVCVVTEQIAFSEPALPFPAWYPSAPGIVNCLLGVDGQAREPLVVIRGSSKPAPC